VPSAFIIQICRDPDRLETNASCDPSGDQAGMESDAAPVVNRCRLDPSALTIRMLE